MYVRALLCQCRHRLEAENDEVLRGVVRKHLKREHAAPQPNEELLAEIVSAHAYDFEYTEGMAEDFGPEPY